MAQFTVLNTKEVEAYTFEEIKQHAKENSDAPHWHFEFKEHAFSHEHDNGYYLDHNQPLLTPNDMLLLNEGEAFVISKGLFNKLFNIKE